MLLYGGYTGGVPRSDTWTYEADVWKQVSLGVAPAARAESPLAEAPGSQLVLFGGTNGGALSDTWTWTGSAWVQNFPAHSPSPRMGHTLVFDPRRGKTLLFGGRTDAGNRLSDLWEWDGSDWRPVRAFDPYGETRPAGLSNSSGAYSPALDRVVLFGGRRLESDPQSLSDETWIWDSGAGSRAGHVFFADLQSARVSFDQMTEAWVRVRAGATTTDPASKDPRSGVSLLLWDQNRWREPSAAGATSPASSDAPDSLELRIGQKELQRTLFGPSMYLPVAVVPTYPNGSGATVSLDYVEVRLTYTATEVKP